MICVSLQNKTCEEILALLSRVEMAEIRLDRCELSEEEIEEVFSSDTPTIATCRIGGEVSVDKARRLLTAAIKAGASFVDVEIEAPKSLATTLRTLAREYGTRYIRSWHDFEGTPSLEALKAMVEKCLYHGAEWVKIVTTAHSQEDAARVLSLYDEALWTDADRRPARGGLVAFAMGEAGRSSRLDCLRLGSPYTYAALTEAEATAAGQWTYDALCQAVYGVRVAASEAGAAFGAAETQASSESPAIPCSKSFAQRAIIAAALAEGTSVLTGYTPCRDNEAALAVATSLGAVVVREKAPNGVAENLRITGIAARKNGLDLKTLFTGESGLLTRMMIPLCAMLSQEGVLIEGERTLLKRPLGGAKEILDAFGAKIENVTVAGEASAQGSGGEAPAESQALAENQASGQSASAEAQVPLRVKGPLGSGRVDISGRNGSQLISGLLMALPLGEKNTTLSVSDPKSIPYIFITLDVLKHFGIRIGNELLGGRDFMESNGDWNLCNGIIFKIKGGGAYKACEMTLEGDWSAAANFLVAGAIFGAGGGKRLGSAAPLVLQGLDTTSLQADLSIMDVLMDCGACLSQLDGDQGELVVQRAPLQAFCLDASHCPDLFPILAILAAFCEGESRIGGVGRLAHKESHRGKAIVNMLTQMGVAVRLEGDEMVIEGLSLAHRLLSGRLLHGGQYTSCDDHRMVMALKVASLGADGPIEIDNEACVEKSFPGFFASFQQYLV
ncbi:MAG: type I 3-dehydroquinate dehydratase [Bacteroidales bacterium]|nr:type I 3-dehydroquinate dehydratase [Bacteroidales bacterium]